MGVLVNELGRGIARPAPQVSTVAARRLAHPLAIQSCRRGKPPPWGDGTDFTGAPLGTVGIPGAHRTDDRDELLVGAATIHQVAKCPLQGNVVDKGPGPVVFRDLPVFAYALQAMRPVESMIEMCRGPSRNLRRCHGVKIVAGAVGTSAARTSSSA